MFNAKKSIFIVLALVAMLSMIYLTPEMVGLNFKGKVILISDKASGIESSDLLEVTVRCEHPDLFAIPSIIPVQLMVNAWAEEMKLVPGSFTHGAKVTAIE